MGAGIGTGMGAGISGRGPALSQNPNRIPASALIRLRRGSDFIYTKNLRATGIEFYLHKEFLKKSHEKLMMYSKNFPRCARPFVENVLRKDMC